MEAIDKILAKLGDLLRYFAPGVVGFVLVAALRDDVNLEDLSNFTGLGLYMLVGLILLGGVATYAIHRYILVWPLWALVMQLRRWLNAYPPIPEQWTKKPLRQVMFELDMQRILRGASSDPVVRQVSRHQARWSSLQHYLYTSGYLCILVPLLVNTITPGHVVESNVTPCLWLGAVARAPSPLP